MPLSDVLSSFVTHHHEWSLKPITAVLEKLGNPHHRLPPTIYLTGTNGKGSTAAFLYSCLKEAGLRVHRYTSPHLVNWTERIVLANKEICTEKLTYYLRECARHQTLPLSVFEALTAAAFLAFAEHPADALIAEVGMGGRLDATNILPASSIATCVITPISLDHVDSLGPTLAHIAREKVGILRPHVPCISSAQRPEAAAVIAEKAATLNAPLFQEGAQWHWQLTDTTDSHLSSCEPAQALEHQASTISENPGLQVSLWNGNTHIFPHIGLVGDHQKENAATAVATLYAQKQISISPEAIHRGLSMAYWPGRLHPIKEQSVCQYFPGDYELWVDGAHNPGGAEILRHHIQKYWADGRPLILVIGMLARKDSETFWNLLAPLAQEVWIINEFMGQETTSAETFLTYLPRVPLLSFSTLETLLRNHDRSCAFTAQHPRILFCGSLYFVGHIINLTKNN